MAIFATFQMLNIGNETCIPCDLILLKTNIELQNISKSDNLISLYDTFVQKDGISTRIKGVIRNIHQTFQS
jgi:hypothetical protein